jgi:5,10-methylene-tetrahydrofolate dehydrogenase/methenyl tetrahydrofolate cyclohydrolase
MKLLKAVLEDLSGFRAIIVGRAKLERPMAQLLLKENCAVINRAFEKRRFAGHLALIGYRGGAEEVYR